MSVETNDEREFLHDLASPLGTAIFLADSLLDGLQNRPGVNPDDLMQMATMFETLEKMKILLQNRRELLIIRGVPSART